MNQQAVPPAAPRPTVLGALGALLALSLIASTQLHSQTIEWASEFNTDFQTSTGDPLDNTFVFELGAFANLFEPDADNRADWLSNWRVFDEATYNAPLGFFSSTADMNPQGGSSSPQGDAAFDFQGLQAYIWIRNNDQPVAGAEWFLAEKAEWIYPTALDDCCNNAPPLQWVINSAVPPGDPIVTVAIPEPSSALLMLAAATLLLTRRR